MRQNPINSSVALLLVVIIVGAIIGWIAYSQDGAITETVQVGGEGIRKAQEIKRELEESSQSQPSI